MTAGAASGWRKATLTAAEAEKLAADLGYAITRRSITRAVESGAIAGGTKVGGHTGIWLIPRKAFVAWLESPRRPGPKPGRKAGPAGGGENGD